MSLPKILENKYPHIMSKGIRYSIKEKKKLYINIYAHIWKQKPQDMPTNLTKLKR